MLSKNVNNKKCAPKLIFFNEKKIEKDSDNFWYRKLTLKVGRLGDFALFDTSPLVQFSKFKNFLWVCWLGWTLKKLNALDAQMDVAGTFFPILTTILIALLIKSVSFHFANFSDLYELCFFEFSSVHLPPR